MSLQSERLLNDMLRLRLSHLANCYEAMAEEASSKILPYFDFLEQTLESESRQSRDSRRALLLAGWKHTRNVRLKPQWAYFPYNKGLHLAGIRRHPSRPDISDTASPTLRPAHGEAERFVQTALRESH